MKLLLLYLLCFPLLSMQIDTPVKTVYICMRPKAQVYHVTSKCRGLNRCSAEINQLITTWKMLKRQYFL